MPSHYLDCVYIECKNNCSANKELTFFSFPSKDTTRCKEWVMNCGNRLLYDLEATAIKNKLVCQNHFHPELIFISGKRKLLSRSSVPVKFDSQVEQQHEQSGKLKLY